MKSFEEQLYHIEEILDALIANEERLQDLSSTASAYEEIKNIQAEQASLLQDLQKADKEFTEASIETKDAQPITVKQRINEKLHRFQALNDSFIDHLKTGPHFIHFETHRSAKKIQK